MPEKVIKVGSAASAPLGFDGHEYGSVEKRRSLEFIHGVRPENVCFGDLAGHLGLVALIVEGGAERAGVGWLVAIVAQDADIAVVLVAEVMIHARRPLIFLIGIGRSGAELVGAGYSARAVR